MTDEEAVPATPEAKCPFCGKTSGHIISRERGHTCFLRCPHATGVGEQGGVPVIYFGRGKADGDAPHGTTGNP